MAGFESSINKIIGQNISSLLSKKGKDQIELAEYLGVSQATISYWCKGVKAPRMDKIDRICAFFNVSRSDLMDDHASGKVAVSKSHRINVLGRVAAGIPLEAIEEVIDTEEISEEMAKTGEFFGLKIKGDSMEPRICSGDVVIVRKQEDAESGDIVIAMVNGDDAVCKRLVKYASSIALMSLNSKYEPMVFTQEEVDSKPVRVIGKVVELRGKL